jgi:hypothetical protein
VEVFVRGHGITVGTEASQQTIPKGAYSNQMTTQKITQEGINRQAAFPAIGNREGVFRTHEILRSLALIG